jgi:hypothetical protein
MTTFSELGSLLCRWLGINPNALWQNQDFGFGDWDLKKLQFYMLYM